MGKHKVGSKAPSAPRDGLLFQERLRPHPFWMMVACSLVNLTTWEQAKPAFAALQTMYPTPDDLSRALEEDLHPFMRPLGLWRRRSLSIIKLAKMWAEQGPPADALAVKKYPGLGQYASDSWAIFVDGRTDVLPNDGKLNWYMERLRAGQDDEGRREVQPGDHRPADSCGANPPL